MTHLRSKRLPGAGRTLAAVVGLVAALALGAVGQADAAPPGPDRFADRPHGFAALAGGPAFDPRDFHDYRLDPSVAVPASVKRFAGPQPH
ncbi:hypothetical protein [Streptomyces sp. NPDC057877]|uniref:hypothetical protein n=1 Tax=Streptomyces sp. NPDC057877 TaxID=3346269 RepID=UPI003685C7CA